MLGAVAGLASVAYVMATVYFVVEVFVDILHMMYMNPGSYKLPKYAVY